MGIAPYKTFTFDGVSSDTYGVYLTGEGVFNAPTRAVEMLEIPGRNGDFALDQGKFNNITVTYKAGIVDASESNFADKMSNVRNWLCSKVGYKRLSDEYNSNEYRMAVFMNGVDLDHVDLKTGEFEITFECKPQRWLTSGETATAVANNGTLSNPTLFESEPLLAVKGYGGIHFNGYDIDIANVSIGDITLYEGGTDASIVIDEDNLNTSDVITVDLNYMRIPLSIVNSGSGKQPSYQSDTLTDSNSSFYTAFLWETYDDSKSSTLGFQTSVEGITFAKGTNSTVTNTVSGTVTVKNRSTSTTYSVTVSATQTITYTASTHTIAFTYTGSASTTQANTTVSMGAQSIKYNSIKANSTKSALGNPTYIDCEIGECYFINGTTVVSVNNAIALGSDLPKLSPGTNTFTMDNTITECKVTPRYWKV